MEMQRTHSKGESMPPSMALVIHIPFHSTSRASVQFGSCGQHFGAASSSEFRLISTSTPESSQSLRFLPSAATQEDCSGSRSASRQGHGRRPGLHLRMRMRDHDFEVHR